MLLTNHKQQIQPENLGGNGFTQAHHTRFPYIVGEMAHGISTAHMVINAAKAGLFASFGAAGLTLATVEKNIRIIQQALGSKIQCWSSNLINSPQDPALEATLVDLYLRLSVRRISASAYLTLSPHLVRYAVTGLRCDQAGNILRQNFILAKLSRPEVAKLFMSPPPQEILQHLLIKNLISAQEAKLATNIPLAADITVEADSAGHTDNRPLTALMSAIQIQASMMQKRYSYHHAFRLGAAGGLGTPQAIAAAFALGCDYVLTGSINAAAVESSLSLTAKQMLAAATISDVMMAPAADMFEMGIKLQVLKRGTLFALRAAKLYELYKRYPSIADIPLIEQQKIEQEIFRESLANVWSLTQNFFLTRGPEHLMRAEQDAKYKMALIFRWYLGQSSHWAIQGDHARRIDYQLWCSPAMGAFNHWVANTCLEALENRSVVNIAMNLLNGAAHITHMHMLRALGNNIPEKLFKFSPQMQC